MTFRSKEAYGRTISTVGPPVFWFPSVKVMLGLRFRRFSWVLWLTKYVPVVLSRLIPNTFSNCWQTSTGSHSSGTTESINANSGVDISVEFPELVVAVMERIVRTISLRLSPVIVKTTSFGVNREASYPPNIRLPNTLFNR